MTGVQLGLECLGEDEDGWAAGLDGVLDAVVAGDAVHEEPVVTVDRLQLRPLHPTGVPG